MNTHALTNRSASRSDCFVELAMTVGSDTIPSNSRATIEHRRMACEIAMNASAMLEPRLHLKDLIGCDVASCACPRIETEPSEERRCSRNSFSSSILFDATKRIDRSAEAEPRSDGTTYSSSKT